MQRNAVLDGHTRVQSRLQATLDRELKRYEMLRKMTDDRIAAAENAEMRPQQQEAEVAEAE